jgi:5-methyltetrahydrofolate--homocysteine methyltransferase
MGSQAHHKDIGKVGHRGSIAKVAAERLHQRVRTELWGCAPDEALSNEDLIAEKYRGIRPAPGYPACPDHRAKRQMFEVLKAAEIGMGLTESLAMTPAACARGALRAHPAPARALQRSPWCV